jgi:hypothetical protein
MSRWLLAAASTLFGLYLAESLAVLAPRLRPACPDSAKAGAASDAAFDRRSALEVIADEKARGRQVWPHTGAAYVVGQNGIPSPGGRLLPIGGISNAEVTHCAEFGVWNLYRTDEHGFNNPRGLYKPDGVDAVLIGDSFTEGACVPREQSVAGRLRARGLKAVSLGTGGIGPLAELAALREYGRPLRPRRVYWLYYASDPDDLLREQASPTLRKYLQRDWSQGLMSRQKEIDAAWRDYLARARQGGASPSAGGRPALRVGRFLRLYYLRALINGAYPLDRSDHRTLELMARVIASARDEVRSWGGELAFVYLPERTFFISPRRADRFRGPLLAAVRAEGIPVVDMLGEFRRDPEPLSFFFLGMSTHYDAKGHQAVADAMLQYAPCRPKSGATRNPTSSTATSSAHSHASCAAKAAG